MSTKLTLLQTNGMIWSYKNGFIPWCVFKVGIRACGVWYDQGMKHLDVFGMTTIILNMMKNIEPFRINHMDLFFQLNNHFKLFVQHSTQSFLHIIFSRINKPVEHFPSNRWKLVRNDIDTIKRYIFCIAFKIFSVCDRCWYLCQ